MQKCLRCFDCLRHDRRGFPDFDARLQDGVDLCVCFNKLVIVTRTTAVITDGGQQRQTNSTKVPERGRSGGKNALCPTHHHKHDVKCSLVISHIIADMTQASRRTCEASLTGEHGESLWETNVSKSVQRLGLFDRGAHWNFWNMCGCVRVQEHHSH